MTISAQGAHTDDQAPSVPNDTDLAASLGAFRSEHAEVNGVRLHYVTGGQGPPLFLLPGWPETWWEYRKVLNDLAEHFTVFVVEFRGMGGSSKPPGGYDKKSMAQDIFALVRHLGFDKVNIAGHGIGAMVAFAYAATHPEATKRLSVLNTTHVDNSYYEFPMLPRRGDRGPHRWWLAFNQVADLPEQLLAGRSRYLVDYMFGLSLVHPEAISSEDRDIYAHAYSTPEAIRASQGWFQAYQQDIDDFNSYDKIAVPMLGLAYGTFFEYMALVLPQQGVDVKLEEIEGSRNYLVEEQPGAVTAALVKFFSVD